MASFPFFRSRRKLSGSRLVSPPSPNSGEQRVWKGGFLTP